MDEEQGCRVSKAAVAAVLPAPHGHQRQHRTGTHSVQKTLDRSKNSLTLMGNYQAPGSGTVW